MRTRSQVLAAIALFAGLLVAVPATAQHVVVNGEMWLKSSPEIRKAFLVGAGNMIALEKAYATKKGTAQPAVGVMAAKAVEGMTLDQVSDRVTRWYQANPQRHDVPVMGVIWIDLVKPASSTAGK